MRNSLKNLFVLSIPLLIKYLFLFLFIDFDLFDIEDIIEDITFFIIISLLIYFPILKKQYFVDFVWIVYLLYVLLEGTSYLAVSSNFSSSYMYLLIDSNKGEITEFISSYFNLKVFFFFFSLLVSFFMLRRIVVNKQGKGIVSILSLTCIVLIMKTTGFIESNVYHNIVRGVVGYYQLQNSLQFTNVIKEEDVVVNSSNEVFVFVIGESTARGHMNIYGYTRETTPKLESIKDSLFVYNNVISTDVLTVKSIPKILTTIDSENENDQLFHLVEFFNIAGFKTFWLSNQRPISWHNNAVSEIASTSKSFKFYNHIIDRHSSKLDGVLLPDYKKILKEPGKKVVFLHLLGTHFHYNKRYPKLFKKFSSNTEEVIDKIETINDYDNAVLYNDYVVFSFIKALEESKTKSALIYLSDHGENVYDNDTDFFGRSEENLYKNMFEIPFIFWASKDFEFPEDFEYKPDRKFMIDHTFESIAHIFGVEHESLDFNKSIFSKSFVERKRIILKSLDFDNYFLE